MNALDGLSIAILLAAVGSLLVVAEVFVPSGGLLAFLSAAAFIGAVYSAYTEGGVAYGLGFAAAEVLLAPVMIYVALLYFPKTPIGRAIVGRAPTEDEVLPEDARDALVGRTGIARTKMLPSGSVEIDGLMLNAVSQGQAIEPGEYVTVTEATGNRLVVRRAQRPESRPDLTPEHNPLDQPVSDLGLESFDFDSEDKPTA